VLCTSREVIMDTKKAKMSELFSIGISISYASFDKYLAEEMELEQVR
jgi:hypothetical protein